MSAPRWMLGGEPPGPAVFDLGPDLEKPKRARRKRAAPDTPPPAVPDETENPGD